MPVEFLSDEQAAAFASFQGVPTRDELRKYFFLDDVDRQRATSKRRDHNKLGFGIQIGAVRYLRRFLPDPRQVGGEEDLGRNSRQWPVPAMSACLPPARGRPRPWRAHRVPAGKETPVHRSKGTPGVGSRGFDPLDPVPAPEPEPVEEKPGTERKPA